MVVQPWRHHQWIPHEKLVYWHVWHACISIRHACKSLLQSAGRFRPPPPNQIRKFSYPTIEKRPYLLHRHRTRLGQILYKRIFSNQQAKFVLFTVYIGNGTHVHRWISCINPGITSSPDFNEVLWACLPTMNISHKW